MNRPLSWLLATSLLLALPSLGQDPADCPYLDDRDARRVLGGAPAAPLVADFDPLLGDASSCRWESRRKPVRRLVVAEQAATSVVGDPFAALRPAELAPFPVADLQWSVLVPASALADGEAWYAGLAGRGVVLLWVDEDGFETAVAVDLPDLSVEAQRQALALVVDRIAGGP